MYQQLGFNTKRIKKRHQLNPICTERFSVERSRWGKVKTILGNKVGDCVSVKLYKAWGGGVGWGEIMIQTVRALPSPFLPRQYKHPLPTALSLAHAQLVIKQISPIRRVVARIALWWPLTTLHHDLNGAWCTVRSLVGHGSVVVKPVGGGVNGVEGG